MNPAKLLALLFLVITLPLQAQPASVSYIPEMEYLRLTPDAQLTPVQAMASDDWQALPEKTPNFGYIRDHIWLRFPIINPEIITLLEISYPQLDHVDFYLIRDGDIVRHESTGDQKSFRERPVQHPHFLFPFQLQPDADYQILLRVETQGAMQIPLKLWNSRSYFEKASVESQLHAGYYGILITVICFNLFVFLALREPVYLLYVLSTFGYLILVGSLNGVTYQLLWPDVPAIQNRAMLLTVPFAMVFTLLFSRSFLRLKRSSPVLDRLILFTIALNVLVAALTFFTDYSTGSRLTVALAIPSCLLLTVVGPLQWVRGNPQAVYYTLAWGALTLGSAITAANKYGLIPNNFITAYGMQIGSALEAILLSLALAVRIYRERQDKVLAREAELRALEARRSAELRLMDQALHHPLTGLPNRSSFEMKLSELTHSNDRKRYGVVIIHLNNLNSVTKTLGHRNSDRILELASKHYNAVIRDVPGAIAIEQSDVRNFYLASLDPQTFAFPCTLRDTTACND